MLSSRAKCILCSPSNLNFTGVRPHKLQSKMQRKKKSKSFFLFRLLFNAIYWQHVFFSRTCAFVCVVPLTWTDAQWARVYASILYMLVSWLITFSIFESFAANFRLSSVSHVVCTFWVLQQFNHIENLGVFFFTFIFLEMLRYIFFKNRHCFVCNVHCCRDMVFTKD